MRNPRLMALAGLTLALLLAASFGCGGIPTQPTNEKGGRAAASRLPDRGNMGISHEDSLGGPCTPPDTIPEPVRTDSSWVLTSPVDGSLGATLRVDRVKVEIPVGAVSGKVQIRVEVTHAGSYVDLEILPADRNSFSTPVRLAFDCAHVSPSLLRNFYVQWRNPDTGLFEVVPGSEVDMTTGQVTAPLSHFSQYRVSYILPTKAGW